MYVSSVSDEQQNHLCPAEPHTASSAMSDPVVLARQALASLEKLNQVLDDPSARWLHSMIDVLRVYSDNLPSIPGQIVITPSTDGIIVRRGLQSFAISEAEFTTIRNAFRRCQHHQKKRRDEEHRMMMAGG